MKDRRRVKHTRAGVVTKVRACGFETYVNVNFYEEDLRPCEVFLTIAKRGSTVGGFARTLAVLLSLMMQYGIPWEVIYNKLHGIRFDPSDAEYSSLVDAIASAINDIVTSVEREDNDPNRIHGSSKED